MCKCPIDSNTVDFIFQEKVLGKYNVNYYKCEHCGIIKTETPHWLDEAYSDAIAGSDIGLLERNNYNSKMVLTILSLLNRIHDRVVDTAGGYGILTRLLRDRGIHCYSSDKYCTNMFASDFCGDDTQDVKVLLAFEVMEHLPDPLAFLNETLFKYDPELLIFSTQTFTETPPENWWYYSFHTGQHIIFYQPKSLAVLADKLGFNYYMINDSYHIFSKNKISKFKFFLIKNKITRMFLNVVFERTAKPRSLLQSDYDEIISK
ncbi:class I SAM-dependent methyltransferase [Vibrio mangrovi]|uniref:Class I SAM-dependent methyltransferase n=1 Tax=Vibrio mangrovi TaxID=474394 RepID=A0A1Y6IWX1_9VIBR|nr:class I SAM-dependent methyltransferase [Vibrio mangrovi]MDW6002166.1 class I SAM-dependent methyltransferase [Vibrio mangrovi]SMS01511.1 hypothetical protein VIM7927_02807 [Vibrio mangrovi]